MSTNLAAPNLGVGLRIGVSACFFHADPKRAIFKGKTLQYVEQSMARWIQSEGALVYMIPAPAKDSGVALSDYASDLDGLVLEGGSDVSPLSYNEDVIKPDWAGDKVRDDYEIALLQAFKKRSKPILGICRGLQLINVAFGGTLYQDINHALPKALVHRNWEIYDSNYHDLKIEPGSYLERMYPNVKTAKINSVHHQAIKDISKELIIEAKSEPDGIIEAARYQGTPWIYGVQWHPEFQEGHKGLLDERPLLREFLTEVHKQKES